MEGNVISNGGNTAAQYVYAFDHRVRAQVGSNVTEYDYDYAGKRILTYLPGKGISEQQHYWDNRQFAYWAEDGTTYFEHRDALGTERMRTNYSGAISSEYSSSALPFNDGDSTVPSGYGSDQDTLRFAGLNKDSATTDNAQFRQYSQTHGRWMSPDPYDGSMDLGNPQTLNRYSYVGNNPLRFTDPSGLCSTTQSVTVYADRSQGDYASSALACGFWDAVKVVAGAIGSGFEAIGHGFEHLFGFGHPSFKGTMTARPSVGGGWNGRYMAQGVFQGPGSGSFVGANTAVNYATAGTAVAYTGAFAAPYVAQGAGALGQRALFGPTANRIFWSGSGYFAAQTAAQATGGNVLEMTPVGGALNMITQGQGGGFGLSFNTVLPAWQWASQAFATGAAGPVLYYPGLDGYMGQTWLNIESGILASGGNPISTMP